MSSAVNEARPTSAAWRSATPVSSTKDASRIQLSSPAAGAVASAVMNHVHSGGRRSRTISAPTHPITTATTTRSSTMLHRLDRSGAEDRRATNSASAMP